MSLELIPTPVLCFFTCLAKSPSMSKTKESWQDTLNSKAGGVMVLMRNEQDAVSLGFIASCYSRQKR